MDSDSSEINLVITTRRTRIILFWKLYWKNIIFLTVPLLFMPVYLIEKSNALHIGTGLLDCLSIMMIIIAIEKCKINKRIAVKFLLIFGCSHYRLSFMLFFSTMFISMWLSDIVGCGIMMPLVKAILMELENMGLLEMYHNIGKFRHSAKYNVGKNRKPTDFTVFYFLGIAYSATIGGMATILGSETNQIFKMYSGKLFPLRHQLEFPEMILLNLPGILLMEGFLYFWMNSSYLGMFREHSDIALEIGLSEEEARYISTLLESQYQKLGKISFHESIVGVIIILTCFLRTLYNSAFIMNYSQIESYSSAFAPCMLPVIILFITPIDLEFLKFFKKGNEPLPVSPSKSCLDWQSVHSNLDWSVLFVLASSSSVFSALKHSQFLDEVGSLLVGAKEWPVPAQAFLVVLISKLLTELASNATVAYCILPIVANLTMEGSVNPHYLMLAATLGCSLPFHLITGSPVNAMVAAYVNIPPWKMVSAGIGPSLVAVAVTWLTVTVWSKAIWTDLNISN